jgi:hypothetical protein
MPFLVSVIGVGLMIVGVPSAPLWGIMATILRFVAYIGAVIAAIFPLILAASVGSGWMMVLWTGALFLVIESTPVKPSTSRLRPCLGPISSGRYCLREFLNLVGGSDWVDLGDTIDNLPGGVGAPY